MTNRIFIVVLTVTLSQKLNISKWILRPNSRVKTSNFIKNKIILRNILSKKNSKEIFLKLKELLK